MNYESLSKAYDECVYNCHRTGFWDSSTGDLVKVVLGIGIGYGITRINK